MDASESDTGADRAAAEPVDSGPGAAPQPGPGAAPQPDDVALAASQPGDAELAATVRSVDEGQVQEGVPLTVLVGGALFVGELVSGARWWEEAATLARGAGGDTNTQFADGADAVSQLYRETALMERRPVGYLHMRNAVMGSDRQVGLWRILLVEVQAWHWGN